MIKLFTICFSLSLFLYVLELVRREKMTFQYAFGWIIVSLLGVLLTVFDQFLFDISKAIGFELPSNFIFFTLLCVFIFLSLVMTIFSCQQNMRNDRIAQKIGLLEQEMQMLKESKKNES